MFAILKTSALKLLFAIWVNSLFTCSAFTQNKPLTLTGLILDATTHQGIPSAHVVNLKKGAGVITDSTGRFTLAVTEFPLHIVFKHVAYFPDTLLIINSREFKKNFSVDENIFFLRTNVFIIDEVMVRANARKLFEDEPFAIIDYQLVKDRIVVFGYRNYNELKKEVAVSDLSGKILWTRPVPKVNELFKDCLGALYLVENDSAHLVTVWADSLRKLNSCHITYFSDFIRPVHVVTDSITVFSKTSPVKQYRNYFLIRGRNAEAERIYQAGNIGKESGLMAVNQRVSYAFREVMKTNNPDYLGLMYRMAFTGIHEKQINYKPVHADLFPAGDSLLLFDFTAGTVIRFSEKVDKCWKLQMQIAFNKDWVHRMHHDTVTDRYYLEFASGPYTYLIEIDPVSGTEVRKIPIPTYNHIDHIQVINNRVWFLHQPDFGDRGKKLYYQDL